MKEGFKYAYLQFIKSYSRRDFKVIEQMCETNLINAIKKEPLRNDELIKYKNLENEDQSHFLINEKMKSDMKILDFQILDYNMNFGVSVERD